MSSFMVTNKKEGLTWFVSEKTAQDAKEYISEIGYDIGDLTVRQATTRDVYIHVRVPDIIRTYRKEALRFQTRFNSIQITLIILSALVTGTGWFASRWIIALLGIAITVTTGINLHFKYREKYYNLRQTADEMEVELNAYKLTIGQYGGENDTTIFIKRFEYLREEQQKRQLQLEQSSHIEQKPLNPNQ